MEVARVQPDLTALAMELAADPVVLVLDPDDRPEAGQDLGGVLGRRREHELQRMEQRQLGRFETILAGEDGCLADVAGQHACPLDGVQWTIERFRDRRLDQALPEPDPEVARDDADDPPGGLRLRARQERGEQGGLSSRP